MTLPTRTLPAGTTLTFSIDLSRDRKALIWMQIIGTLLTILFAFVFLAAFLLLRPELRSPAPFAISLSLLQALGMLAALVLAIPLHELVHGAVFWLLTGARPRFGFRGLYAYTAAPDWYLPRRHFIPAALAPLVLLSLLGVLLAALLPAAFLPALFIFLIANAGGAVGDLWIVAKALRQPGTLLVHDLGDAVHFYTLAPPGAPVPATREPLP